MWSVSSILPIVATLMSMSTLSNIRVQVMAQIILKNYVRCGGNGVLNYVKVTPCSEEPCHFKRKSKVEVELEAAFDKPSNTLRMDSIAQLGPTNMTLTGTPTDLCKQNIVECPVGGRGDVRTVHFIVPIKAMYSPKYYNATFAAYGDNDEMELCVTLLVNIIE